MRHDRKLFLVHEVESKVDDKLNTYFCLERIADGSFTVMQMSIFRQPFSGSDLEMARMNFKEVVLDMEESEYFWHRSVHEAIARHDVDFGN